MFSSLAGTQHVKRTASPRPGRVRGQRRLPAGAVVAQGAVPGVQVRRVS